MSGYVGSQRIMEPSTSTSYLTNTPQPILASPNLASTCGNRADGRFANGKIRKESKYIENSRQDKLFSRVWLPCQANTSPKGLVFICHGYGEHSQWYDKFCERLCSNEHNMICFSHDHLGHGLSEGERATIPDIEWYVDDVIQHVLRFKCEYRSTPFFIFGHSMGGLIALRAVQRNPGLFNGMALMGPLIKTTEEIPTSQILAARLASYVYPTFQARSFPLDHVTSDSDMLLKLKVDPLRWNEGMKISMIVSLYNAVQVVNEFLPKVTTPFLSIHAENDKLCSIEGSRHLHNVATACTDKSLIIFPEGEHNLFAESPDIRRQAINEVVVWITERCSCAKGPVNIVDRTEAISQ